MITATAQESRFRAVISNVRKVFSGTLTYSANWGTKYQVTATGGVLYGGEIDWINFIDALDVIGVDAYYYLTNQLNPSMDDLMTGWAPIVTHLTNISTHWQKPIIFTEIGYRSIEGGAIKPGQWNSTAPYNASQQALAYNAVFASFMPQSWWGGIFWWCWSSDPNNGEGNDIGYSPAHKPAQQVMQHYYSIIP